MSLSQQKQNNSDNIPSQSGSVITYHSEHTLDVPLCSQESLSSIEKGVEKSGQILKGEGKGNLESSKRVQCMVTTVGIENVAMVVIILMFYENLSLMVIFFCSETLLFGVLYAVIKIKNNISSRICTFYEILMVICGALQAGLAGYFFVLSHNENLQEQTENQYLQAGMVLVVEMIPKLISLFLIFCSRISWGRKQFENVYIQQNLIARKRKDMNMVKTKKDRLSKQQIKV